MLKSKGREETIIQIATQMEQLNEETPTGKYLSGIALVSGLLGVMLDIREAVVHISNQLETRSIQIDDTIH